MPPKKRAKKRVTSSKDIRCTENETEPKQMKRKLIFQLKDVVRATVVNRPSKTIKSPYMADITLDSDLATSVLCHSPSLGCAGIIVPGTRAIVTPKTDKNSKSKSKYSLDLVDVGSSIIGVNPLTCNKMTRLALEDGLVQGLPCFEKSEIKAECSVGESRFDFKCVKDEVEYFIEVKGVPCACIEDVPRSPSKKLKNIDEINKAAHKIAYFPDGYRKKSEEAISPRALKHVEHLQRLLEEDNSRVCVLLFIVQRTDCQVFQPSHNDPLYREAVCRASETGVRVLANSIKWTEDGGAVWGDSLPINLKDDQDNF